MNLYTLASDIRCAVEAIQKEYRFCADPKVRPDIENERYAIEDAIMRYLKEAQRCSQ